MKKIIFMLFMAVSVFASAAENGSEKAAPYEPAPLSKAEANRLIARLHEIHDVTQDENLSKAKKAMLRKEVEGIKAQLTGKTGGGIYLSTGALLIIIILLIILL